MKAFSMLSKPCFPLGEFFISENKTSAMWLEVYHVKVEAFQLIFPHLNSWNFSQLVCKFFYLSMENKKRYRTMPSSSIIIQYHHRTMSILKFIHCIDLPSLHVN